MDIALFIILLSVCVGSGIMVIWPFAEWVIELIKNKRH